MVAAMQRMLRSLRASIGLLCAAGTLVLAGCASAPPKTGAASAERGVGTIAQTGRDGSETNPPSGLDQVPDAQPRLESIRFGGPNKPYEVLGRDYVPITQDRAFSERGLASWYGRKFHGRRTSSGELYDMYAMTAAHPTLPIPSYARVRNPANGREVVVRVNDRGPFHAGRIIDLSYTAALKLDLLRGVAPVEVERITSDEIRAGTWRRGASPEGLQLASGTGSERAEPAGRASALVPVSQVVQIAAVTAVAPPTPEATPVVATLASIATPSTTDVMPIADAPNAQAYTRPARGFWIQLGAFRERDGATAFQRRIVGELGWLTPLLAVFGDSAFFRLQAGPYPSRDEARDAAASIRAALQLVPVIVERR